MNKDDINTAGHSIGRRRLVGLAATAAALPISIRPADAQGTGMPISANGIKALTFDVQGTLLDYFQPFIRVATSLDHRKNLQLNWPDFLRDWNAAAASIIRAINAGTRRWIPAGSLLREAVDNLLAARELDSHFSSADRLELMSVWGQMEPWPDAGEAIPRLRRRFTIATLSNAGMAAVIALTKRSGLSFDAVFTGELVHDYKPASTVYHAASEFLGYLPGEIMMVAAHKVDLEAAKSAGFQTAFIPRPLETGPGTPIDQLPETFIDVVAANLIDLADKLGAPRR